MHTIIEPFRIKSVEKIKFTTIEDREKILEKAYYNPFLIPAEDVLIDLLTDSGTSAMSAQQWAGIMDGDESYAGSRSYFRFEEVTKKIFGYKHIIPVHQGRAAERILFTNFLSKTDENGNLIMTGRSKGIPNNNHFDTTRANIEFNDAEAVDLVIEEGKHPATIHPFKGNIDLVKLEEYIQKKGAENIPVIMLTITNNAGGGQPVSMENIRKTGEIAKKHGIPFFMDACRFAENAYFIKLREKGYENKCILEIAQEMFSYTDGCTMSAKKDAFANIGGFVAMNDEELYTRCRNLLIITEGFETYGGLAGRDMEAIAQGLEEILDEHYLQYRIRSTAYLGDKLTANGIPIILPVGGHAIYVDAKEFLSHIPVEQYPGQALVCELFRMGGIRSVEIGSIMFGKYDKDGKMVPADMELVRLAIPRRVYTQSHIDYVAEVFIELKNNKDKIKGVKIIEEPKFLRHFTSKFSLV
ncbi:MAG: tryptophanase [Ignavibacteriae bacterium]|nr:MAG: tryptophanase [Ignavibacteriota bacterium]